MQQSPLFTRYADQLVGVLRNGGKEGAAIDMVRMYNFTTFDVMVRSPFSRIVSLRVELVRVLPMECLKQQPVHS
jgi:hypothetical protein